MGKYLKKFQTTAQYNAYTADTANFIKPNVSLITDTNTVEYNPYTITPITDAVITCDSATYNGQTQIATNIVVTLSGETLINGTDYTVSGNEGGINAGDYTFTVNGIGNYGGSKNGTFTIGKASRTLSWVSSPSDVISGSSITVEAAPSLGVGDGIITYSSSDTTKATVNGNVVSGVGVGSCTITATISEGTNYLSASTSYSLTVKEYRVVAKFNVTDTSNSTRIVGGNLFSSFTSGFSAIEIDGVSQPSVVSAYTFSTTGEHTVKYTLIDPTLMGVMAFAYCSSLTSIEIPSGVTSIMRSTFLLSSLTSIDIPDSVTSIDFQAFALCDGLTSIDIPSGVTSIGDSAFTKCHDLTSVTIPNSVTSIGESAFDSCINLISVKINATTPPTLGSGAFNNNASGRKIYVPSASVNTYKAATNWSTYASDIEPIS